MKKLVMLATNMLLAAILMAPLPSSVNAATQTTVDINNASADELKSVKGIGDATAKKIIAGRPYASVDDLAKAGVSKSTISKIRSQVTVGAAQSAKSTAAEKPEKKAKEEPKTSGTVNLNQASEKELEDLPGVGAATAKKIIAGRPYASVDDLAKAGVPKNTIEKITSMVTVGAPASAPAAGTKPMPAPVPAPSPAAASGAKPTSAPTMAQQPPMK